MKKLLSKKFLFFVAMLLVAFIYLVLLEPMARFLIFLNQQTYAHHNEIFTHLFNVTCQDWRGFVREILPNIDVEQLINSINNLKKVSARHLSIFIQT